MEIFEEFVNIAFHSGSRGRYTKGFGTSTPVDTLANLQRLYRKPRYQEIDAALLCLNNPTNRMQPVEFMLIWTEELKLFLLSKPDEDRAITKPNLISYAMIELTMTRGMYAKGPINGKKATTG